MRGEYNHKSLQGTILKENINDKKTNEMGENIIITSIFTVLS